MELYEEGRALQEVGDAGRRYGQQKVHPGCVPLARPSGHEGPEREDQVGEAGTRRQKEDQHLPVRRGLQHARRIRL